MLKKNKGNIHYTICNSQVPASSKYAYRNIFSNGCNCAVLYKEEQEKILKSTAAAYQQATARHNANNIGTTAALIGNYSGTVRGYYSTAAMPSQSNLAKTMYDRVNVTNEVKKPYIKSLTYYDILLDTLNALKNHIYWYPLYDKNIDILSIASKNFDHRCEEALINNPQLLKMPKPEMKLVMIGMDVDLRYLSSTSFVVKPLKGSSYNGTTLRRGTFWVLHEPIKDTPPFYLFEFPSNQGLQPKSDLVLLIDPYIPKEDFLTECVYHKFGIKIMKKFDIKDARKLLDTRKTVFSSAPTATNTILLFQLMDAIVLNYFKSGVLDLDKTGEKNLVRLEKLKNLALDTKFNEERKNAVDKAFMQFDIICSKKEEEKVG